jgi:hypothetical protein
MEADGALALKNGDEGVGRVEGRHDHIQRGKPVGAEAHFETVVDTGDTGRFAGGAQRVHIGAHGVAGREREFASEGVLAGNGDALAGTVGNGSHGSS